METVFFGGGCFWCIEAPFALLKGVQNVIPGYMGGHINNPTYEMVCSGQTGHAEVVRVKYDSSVISLSDLLDIFFTIHDPTTLNRQGADVGTQYRSTIFVQKKHFNDVHFFLKKISNSNIFSTKPVTEVLSLSFEDWSGRSGVTAKTFWPAENYHENYFNKNQNNTYCSVVIAPKINKIKDRYPGFLKE